MGAEGRHSFRAVPHCGERPSPHQETEADTSARNTTRSHSNIVRNHAVPRKVCRLTPPAKAGSSHRQTAWGGEVNTLCPEPAVANPVPLSKISERFAQAEIPLFRSFRLCRKRAFPWDVFAFRLLHPPLKRTLMKTNFNVNLNLKKYSLSAQNFPFLL